MNPFYSSAIASIPISVHHPSKNFCLNHCFSLGEHQLIWKMKFAFVQFGVFYHGSALTPFSVICAMMNCGIKSSPFHVRCLERISMNEAKGHLYENF